MFSRSTNRKISPGKIKSAHSSKSSLTEDLELAVSDESFEEPTPTPSPKKRMKKMPAPSVTKNQKLFVLLLLVVQNASVVIMTRYSRGVLQESYLSSTVVLSTEVVKFTVAMSLVAMGSSSSWLNTQPMSVQRKLVWLIRNSGYSWIPAVSYFFQNSLQYTALENLPSSVYAVLQQLKIMSAALFAYFMLRKELSWRKWRALSLLVAGGVLVEHHTFQLSQTGESEANMDPIKGTIAILVIVALSGFAGNITQMLLQNKAGLGQEQQAKELSIWDRNVQLAFWSMIIGSVKVGIDSPYISAHGGFFGGWTLNTLILIFLWVAGGFLVAMTIKYTDVIIKGFASAISMVVISVLGSVLLSDPLGLVFSVGAFVVIVATFNYNEKDTAQNGAAQNGQALESSIVIVDKKEAMAESEIQPLTSRDD